MVAVMVVAAVVVIVHVVDVDDVDVDGDEHCQSGIREGRRAPRTTCRPSAGLARDLVQWY